MNYLKSLSVGARVKAVGARVGIGAQKTMSVKIGAGVPLLSVVASRVPLASLFLLAGKGLWQELQQVCGSIILIDWLGFKDK